MGRTRPLEVDRIFSFATAETPGCAVGVSQRGKVVVNRAYGLANVERRVPLSQRSLFDIGSTQKQFTAAAVLLLVEDGRLALSDDIRKHIPELPDYGHKVTVDHLLTHTSGVRDWTGMLPMAEEGTDVMNADPAPARSQLRARRGVVLLEQRLRAREGDRRARERNVVRRVRAQAPVRAARACSRAPTSPTSCRAARTPPSATRRTGDGWKPYMRLGNNRGGGAIVSTVGDLVAWTDALASGKLGKLVTAKIQEPARLANGRKLKYARGLMVDSTPGGLVVSHSGGAAGFSTWMGHVPEHGLSVAVSCNFDPVSATALAERVSDLYLPPLSAAARAEAAAATAGAAGVDVSSRAGLYFDERTGEPMRLGVNEGRLRIANGPPLVALAQDRFRGVRADLFFRSQDAFEMRFPSNDQLELKSMEGQTTRYRRAQPWTPTAADLQAVDGRYESTELGSVFEIVPGTNGLVMRFERAPDKALELTPVERDTYMLRMMIVRFRRDASGKVVGFDYGNPVVRSIAFTRLGDRSGGAPASTATAPTDPAPAATPAPRRHALPRRRWTASWASTRSPPGARSRSRSRGAAYTGSRRAARSVALTHDSGTTFSAAGSPITLTFTLGADGRATAAVMRQNGRERTLPKVR